MRDPRPLAPTRHLRPVVGPAHPALEGLPIRWDAREVDDLIRHFFASPFGMAQCDDERHRLLADIIDVALRVAGDPTHWDDTLVTAVLVAEMPHQPQIPGRDRHQVPDLLRGFIGFCVAERGLDAGDADGALGMVAHWSAGWNQPSMLSFDPWSAERRVLDELRVEIGTLERLWSLDTDPLLDEPFDVSAVAPAATDAFDEVLTLIDDACAVLADPEVRIAARRLTARVAAGDAAVLVDQPDRAVSAAVLVWVVARANAAFGPGRARVMDLMGHLGLRQASPAGWARPYLRAAGLREHGHSNRVTLGPELLTSSYRRSIIEQRDHCQRVLGDDASPPAVLQIAHEAGGDPRAPSTSQRAPAPRRAR
jgi:hypothetical protein